MLLSLQTVGNTKERGKRMPKTFTIREIRLMKEISQQQAADAVGVHVNTYIAWEKQPEKIPIAKALALAEFFGVSVTEINFHANKPT